MKKLEDLSLEELWELFPVILREHDERWSSWYEEERELIVAALGEAAVFRISHIGSTAVPGLTAKPTIDILLEITGYTPADFVVRQMEGIGYLFEAQPEKPPPHMMFMKGYTMQGFAQRVFHVHVRYPGDWDELYFRDRLREHPETMRAYEALKRRIAPQFRHNRDGYTQAKGAFVRRGTEEARALYGNRYALQQADAAEGSVERE